MKHGSQVSTSRGFSLAEMAIVLVIMAALIGGMTVPLSARIEQRNRAETRRQLDEIRESLIGFAIAHRRLPRPAASLSDGTEKSGHCNDDAACTGFIPWAALGVKKTDAWNKMIRYSVTPAYAADTAFTLATTGSKRILTREDSGTKAYLVGKESGCNSDPPFCTPAVIFSFGKNNGGFTPDGGEIAVDSTNADEDVNAKANKDFFARDPSNVPTGGEFDDILVWIPPYLLFNRMIAAGQLP